MKNKKKIILLAGKGKSSKIIYNEIIRNHNIEAVILEEPIKRRELVKRRIKRYGLLKVIGQLLFLFIIPKLLYFLSTSRLNEIRSVFNLNFADIASEKIILVESVNSQNCIDIIKRINPDVIILNGTRILSKKFIVSTSATIINTHVGITPLYRGVHGAYWALVNKDSDNCGVTVHLVDEGIDTGAILLQKEINPTKKDNFITYPLLQIGVGLDLLNTVLTNIEQRVLTTQKPRNGVSKYWTHPTLWDYLKNYFFNGIK